jgi:hypothetical protein
MGEFARMANIPTANATATMLTKTTKRFTLTRRYGPDGSTLERIVDA